MNNRPTFIMLVGLPGSGKSTYAGQFLLCNRNCIIISSDTIRYRLWGDESCQDNPEQVFKVMHEETLTYLDKGYDVIYDATNVTRKNRLSILSKIPDYVKKECHVVWKPIEECIQNDFNRERTVGEKVIDKMVRRFQVPYYDEGFHNIRVILDKAYTFEYSRNTYVDMIREKCKIPHDNPHHQLSVYEHMVECEKIIDNESVCWEVYCAAKYHDIGKHYTKTFNNTKSEVTDVAHYYDHQNVGGYLACSFHEHDTYVAWLINNHMEPFFNSKYYNKLPLWMKNDIDIIHKADREAH